MAETEVSLSEELDALRAIYCKPQEFQEHTTSEGRNIIIRYDTSLQRQPKECWLSFLLPPDYPKSIPQNAIVFCDQTSPERLLSIQQDVQDKINELKGDPMLLELCYFAQECFQEHEEESATCNESDCNKPSDGAVSINPASEVINENSGCGLSAIACDTDKGKEHTFNETDSTHGLTHQMTNGTVCESSASDLVTSILQLDHMRSKSNYIKCIKKWTAELSLNGRLIFCKRYILIVLQGRSTDVKDYIIKNRTTNVDVDSRGRSCKERLLNVLCEVSAKEHTRFTDFTVIDDKELPNIEALASFFEIFSMKNVYWEYVAPCLSLPSRKSSKK